MPVEPVSFLLGGAGWWIADRAGGLVFDKATENYVIPGSWRPKRTIQRLTDRLHELEQEHRALVELCEHVLEQRDDYHHRYLEAERELARLRQNDAGAPVERVSYHATGISGRVAQVVASLHRHLWTRRS